MQRFILILVPTVLLAAGCKNTVPQIKPAVARVAGGQIGAPTTTYLITQATTDGGILLSTTAGEGSRRILLTAAEAVDVIDKMEFEFKMWRKTVAAPPVERVIAVVVTGQPYSIELIRRPNMVEPVFRIIIGFRDVAAGLILDRENAEIWVNSMKAALGIR